MIFFMGLPRCGGQTITNIMGDLYPHLKPWHSIEYNKWEEVFNAKCSAIIECFAPIDWCLRCDIRKPHKFILNVRPLDPWFDSCARFRKIARDRNWNHPMWRYPIEQWRDYYWEYRRYLVDKLAREGFKLEFVNVWEVQTIGEFCSTCKLDCPPALSKTLLPNIDRYARLSPAMTPAASSPQVTATFNSFLNPLGG